MRPVREIVRFSLEARLSTRVRPGRRRRDRRRYGYAEAIYARGSGMARPGSNKRLRAGAAAVRDA